jgi:hypothetical protein
VDIRKNRLLSVLVKAHKQSFLDVQKNDSMIDFLGYHTCKPDNGDEFVLQYAPFLSEDNPRQWLGQGYYLWTDSPNFAHHWGKVGYNNSYVIVKCGITYDKNAIFDLVGNVFHQELFLQFYEKYKQRIEIEGLHQPETVGGLIKFLRGSSEDIGNEFLFHAVKIKDSPNSSDKYVIHEGKSSYMLMLERHQICFYKDKITDINKVITNKEIFHKQSISV